MFMAGANSIFNGDKLLTTPNPEFNEDTALFAKLGLMGKPSHTAPLESPLLAQQQQQQHAAASSSDTIVVTQTRFSQPNQQQQAAYA